MRFGLYAGGFLGPFGGAILAVLIPELRDAFDASTSDVTWAITAAIPFLGIADSPTGLAAAWLSAGLGSAFVWAGVNTMAVEAVPGNRAGATSLVSAFKFAGSACAPLFWLPLYHLEPELAFGAAAVGCVALGAMVLRVRLVPAAEQVQ